MCWKYLWEWNAFKCSLDALVYLTDTQRSQRGSDEGRRSQHDYEFVKSDDWQSIQPIPEIEMNQYSIIDQSTTEVEMATDFDEYNLQYSTLADHPMVQEPWLYTTLEVTNLTLQ